MEFPNLVQWKTGARRHAEGGLEGGGMCRPWRMARALATAGTRGGRMDGTGIAGRAVVSAENAGVRGREAPGPRQVAGAGVAGVM